MGMSAYLSGSRLTPSLRHLTKLKSHHLNTYTIEKINEHLTRKLLSQH